MKVQIELCLIPIGVGTSLSPYIAECEKVFSDRGLTHSLHSYGTNVEGDWDEVMAALKECHVRVHGKGAPRIFSSLKVGTRTDKEQSMEDKIKSVEGKLR